MAAARRCPTCGKLICVCKKASRRAAAPPALPAPSAKDLDRVFQGATGARFVRLHPYSLEECLSPEECSTVLDYVVTGRNDEIPAELTAKIKPPREEVLVTVTAPRDLSELRAALAISKSGFHCMCAGGPVLQVAGPDGVRAKITLHHGQSIRWDGTWSSDAELADGKKLVSWLTARGVALQDGE